MEELKNKALEPFEEALLGDGPWLLHRVRVTMHSL